MLIALLLVGSAVSVLAAEPSPPEGPPASPSALQAQADLLPDAADIQEGIEMAQAEEAAREHELESAAAIAEREESRDAFADMGAAETQQLLQATFSGELEKLNSDPARSLSNAEIVRTIGVTAATVTEDGDGALLDAGIPVRTEDEDGDLRKVDLSLEATAEGFETANALSDVSVGDTAADPVQIGEEGVSISQEGAAPSSDSRRFGVQNVFQFETLTDTDTLVSPTASGVEIFNLLRSEESPEVFRFEIDLPPGADLRPDGNNGAEVVREEETIAAVPFPTAIDAQGTEVPVDLGIEGDTIALHVPHLEADFAYPILVDPILEDWVNANQSWHNGYNLQALSNGAWQWTSEPYGKVWASNACMYACWGSGHGLYVSAPSGNYGVNAYAHWAYFAPNLGSYISKAWLTPFWRDNHGCSKSQYSQPHDYDGLWDHLYNGGNWNLLQTNQANDVGSAVLESWGRAVVVGLSSGGGVNIPCWRDLYVGGAAVWLDDWDSPYVSASVSGVPSGWFNEAQQITVGASTGDGGLGVRLVTLATEGKPVVGQDNVGCTGLYGNRCPNTRNSQFKLTGASFAEGITASSVSVEDPTGKPATGGNFQTMVDRGPPEVFLDGQLAEATEDDEGAAQGDKKTETLPLPVYNLKVEAKDGSNGSNLTRRSGVQSIEVFLDKKETPEEVWTQGATEDSRPMTQTYQLKLSKVVTTAGSHELEVKVLDQVGNLRKRVLEFKYFPATGMKDEYVMQHFPLPDGKDHSEEEVSSGPELAINVMNGNLVYRERDVDVEGAAVDLEVERYYNSQLPEAEDTEWGDGWTLAQTPELDPVKAGGSPVPNEAEVLESSGAIEGGVGLPTTAGSAKFDSGLRATLTKRQSGGYELSDETGESATSVAFDATGQAEALLTDGYAKVDYDYEGGALSEIAVEDPGATSLSPEELEPLLEEEAEGGGAEEEAPPSFAGQTAANGMPGIVDVAIDDAGNTWALSRTYAKVLQFNPAGQLVSYFGWQGTSAGSFVSPSGIAVDAEGFIWVADSGNHRVQKLTPSGSSLGSFGSYGSGEEQFIQPYDVAIDDEGNVWVADSGNSRLQKFGPWGEFLGAFGSPGSGDGEFLYPLALDVGPEGDIWVADTFNDRVQKIGPEGEHLLTSEASIPKPEGIVVGADGEAWVSSSSSHAVWHLGSDGEELGRFGSQGSGEGLWLNSPHGLAVDAQSRLFIADTTNNRVVRWALAPPAPERVVVAFSAFGAQGSGEGEMSSPSSIDVAPGGDVWVADTANSRIQHFDSEGEPLGSVGAAGSAPGELSWPMGIATGPEGDVWVADTGNGRVQHFDAEGDHLGEFGTWGEGPGEFSNVVAVATGPEGDLWTLDAGSYRVQHFDAEGNYLGQFGEYGEEKGQFMSPSGLAVAPDGSVWVADTGNLRVQRFSAAGKYRRTLDLGGEEPMPTGVEVDDEGNVWVAEGYGERIRGLSAAGRPIAQFDSESEGYELSLPYALAVGPGDDVWAVGLGNSRIQRFHPIEISASPASVELPADDPSVEVETSGGLISALEGEEAGEHSYEHEGDFLVSHDGPDGETLYEKNAAGLLSKVTLPNGTWAQVEYFADNRVKSVTVKPAGEASKTTTFEYQDAAPRRTVVDPPDAPYVTYEIAADGSVLKWWNTPQPPTFDFLAGTLWDHREEENGLWPGDHVLDVQAFSAEGIASIQIIANGNQLVHETNCAQDPEVKGIECVEPPLKSEWVASTDALAPGHLQIEIIATDHAGGSASKRFWVDIPEPPPPPAPGTPTPPRFADILRFRDEYGLEKVFPVANEIERNERIFDLIKAWYEGEAVARASWERWGVPLRPQDVAEMEYREWYMAVNIPRIEEWATQNRSSTYAGYYMDHPAGGILRVGFTQDQAGALAQLKQQPGMVAVDRIEAYPTTPTSPRISLQATFDQVEAAWGSDPVLASLVTGTGVDERSNKVEVTGTDPVQIESRLKLLLGSGAPVKGVYEAMGEEFKPRDRVNGRIRAGDHIFGRGAGGSLGGCTVGFGAWDRIGTKPNGEAKIAPFVMTAAHCGEIGTVFERGESNAEGTIFLGTLKKFGHVGRTAFVNGGAPFETDAALVKLNAGDLMPRYIYKDVGSLKPVEEAGRPWPGETLCFSAPGAEVTKHPCGEFIGVRVRKLLGIKRYVLIARFAGMPGDSGGPVWSPRLQRSVGIILGGPGEGKYQGWVTPLLVPRNHEYHAAKVPGALNAPGLGTFHLAVPGS
jgi:sugar lactone lactonase YvrE